MLRGDAGLYQSGGRIVHAVRTLRESAEEDTVRRPAGALTVNEVTAKRLQLFMIEHAKFYREGTVFGKPAKIPRPATQNLAELYLARSDKWNVPPLNGITETPTLRRDGSLITAQGYDVASGLLLDMGSVEYPANAGPTIPRRRALGAEAYWHPPCRLPLRAGRTEQFKRQSLRHVRGASHRTRPPNASLCANARYQRADPRHRKDTSNPSSLDGGNGPNPHGDVPRTQRGGRRKAHLQRFASGRSTHLHRQRNPPDRRQCPMHGHDGRDLAKSDPGESRTCACRPTFYGCQPATT